MKTETDWQQISIPNAAVVGFTQWGDDPYWICDLCGAKVTKAIPHIREAHPA